MKSKLFWAGVGASAVYLTAMLTAFWTKFSCLLNMPLNEVGDFLAGAFSPLAFLWLVLGFLQQGRELKISSDALLQQADELKNSVEQSRALVGIAGRQLQAELDVVAYERERIASDRKPKLKLSGHVNSSVGGVLNTQVELQNYGGPAEDVLIVLKGNTIFDKYLLLTGEKHNWTVKLPVEDGVYEVIIEYHSDRTPVKENIFLSVRVTDAGNRIARIKFYSATGDAN